jgi:outer membrane immunogenic protein
MVVRLWGSSWLVASIAVCAVGAAGAADLDVPVYKAPVYKAAPAIVSDWSGFYIGVHGGYGWGDMGIGTPYMPILHLDSKQDPHLGSFDADPKGGLVGVHAGHNWQYGSFVAGLEIDYSFADIKVSGDVGTFTDVCAGFLPGVVSRSVKFDALASARARLGYTVLPNLLAYGTIGPGWGHSEVNVSMTFDGGGSAYANNFGWVGGGGFEYKLLEHVLVRAEYLHYDFGTTTYNTPLTVINAASTVDVVRGGLSYKF